MAQRVHMVGVAAALGELRHPIQRRELLGVEAVRGLHLEHPKEDVLRARVGPGYLLAAALARLEIGPVLHRSCTPRQTIGP
jgi:hypothetical protein